MKTYFIILIVFLSTAFLGLLLGSVNLPIIEVLKILMGQAADNGAWSSIVWNHRVPRVLTAMMAGASLSLSGLFMQTFFRNPLAGPFVLGISSGASLGIAMVVLGGGAGLYLGLTEVPQVPITLAAILGSALIFLVIMFFANKVREHTSLLIIGLMFSSAAGALVNVLQYFSPADNIQYYIIWTFGDLSGVSMNEVGVMFAVLFIAGIGIIMVIKVLNIYLIGEEYAENAGVNLKYSRYLIISITALLAGTTTAYCGPIAFVGLATPHIARMVLDTSDHRQLIPYSAILGATVLLICDLIARLPGVSDTLPLNAVTSILGGPLVIWLIVTKKNLQHSF